MSPLKIVILAITIAVASTRPVYSATPWTPCSPSRWAPNGAASKIIINVYLNPALASYLALPQADIERSIAEATSIFNEQSGAAFALRWSGAPPVGVSIPSLKAIYITYSPTLACGGGTSMAVYGTNQNGIIDYRSIEVRKFLNFNGSQCTSPITWIFTREEYECTTYVGQPACPVSVLDFTSRILHEFGHASTFGDPHPAQSPCPATSPNMTDPNNQQSIMDANGANNAARTLRAWDKHRLANIYQHREQYSSLEYRIRNNSTNQWGGVQVALAAPSHIQHRPVASQNGSSIVLEWNERGGLNRGALKSRWFGTFFANSYEDLTTIDAEAPGGIAIDTINNRAIVVYQRHQSPAYGPNGEVMSLYYKLSVDGGGSFGPEISMNLASRRYGIGVGFDPVTSRFIISYGEEATQNTPTNKMRFVTLPSIGGPLVYTTFSNTPGLEGASIACRNATLGCRFVYRDNQYGLRLITALVNTDGTLGASTNTQVGYYAFGQPSIVWSEAEQQFHLAFRGGFGTIYSFKLASTGTTWTGSSDIFNDSTVAISMPTLATSTLLTFGWYVRWW